MLINNILKDNILSQFICQECRENNIEVSINQSINKKDIIIIGVDDFYNRFVYRPNCSPDCLIIQRCRENVFNVYIVELRNIKGPSGFTISDIVEKFDTCLEDFMSIRFASHFHSDKINIQNIKLLFISDPYDFKKYPDRQDKMKGYKIDALLSQRIPKYFNKHLYIEHKLPDPIINPCF